MFKTKHMKSAEHYLMRWRDNEFELHELIELAQKEARNEAIDDILKLMHDHEEEIYIGVFEDIEKLKL